MAHHKCRATFREIVRLPGLFAFLVAALLVGGNCDAEELTEKEVKKLGSMPKFIATEWAVSGDGTRLAFVARREAGQVVVCDGDDGPVWDEVSNLAFSGNGRALAYSASKGNRFCVVVNRSAGPIHSSVQGLSLSHNGGVVAYYATEEDGEGRVWINGEPRKNHRAVATVTPVVSPTGRVAFAGRTRGTYQRANPLTTRSEDDATWGHTDRLDRDVYILCDRSRGRLFNEVRAPVFSPNSRHYAYAALSGGKWFIVCNRDKVGGPFDDVSDPVWSPNSRKMAYACKHDRQWFVVCGSRRKGPLDAVGVMAFSPRAERLACAVRKGARWVLICDGKTGPECGEIKWIGFSRNAQHLAYTVQEIDRSWMVIDGVQGPTHERIIVPQESVKKTDVLRYVAVDDGEATLVEVMWPSQTDWRNGLR